MNNNPNAFNLPDIPNDKKEKGNRQRPIVEFAIENKLVLKRRSERNRPKTAESKKRKIDDEHDSDKKNQKKLKNGPKKNADKPAKSLKGDAPKNKSKNSRFKTDAKNSKKPQNKKSLQPKKAGANIEKKVKKSPKKLVNTNISLEDIKKWDV
jgi:nucleolar protein 4